MLGGASGSRPLWAWRKQELQLLNAYIPVKMPCLVNGQRRVGKTALVRHFGSEEQAGACYRRKEEVDVLSRRRFLKTFCRILRRNPQLFSEAAGLEGNFQGLCRAGRDLPESAGHRQCRLPDAGRPFLCQSFKIRVGTLLRSELPVDADRGVQQQPLSQS